MTQNKDIGLLKKNKLFSGISEIAIDINFSGNNFLSFREGDVIYQNGDESEYLYLILEGEIKLKIHAPFGVSNFMSKNKNDFFGELELLEKTPRKSSAVANTDCILYKLPQKELFELMARSKSINKTLGRTNDEVEIVPNEQSNEINLNDELEAAGTEISPEIDQQSPAIDTHEIVDTSEITEKLEADIKNLETENNLEHSDIEHNTEDEADKILFNEETIEDKDSEDSIFESALRGDEILSEEIISDETIPRTEEKIETFNESKIETRNEGMSEEISENEIGAEEILQAVTKIHENIELNKNIHSITEALIELFDAQIIRIFLVDRNSNELWSLPFMESSDEIKKVKIGEGLIGSSAASGEIINIVDPVRDVRFLPQVDSIEKFETENQLLFPILDKDRNVVSVIQMLNSGKGEFSKNDELLLSQISNDISVSIINSMKFNSASKVDNLSHLNKFSNFLIDDIKTSLALIKRYSSFIKKKSEVKEVNQVSDFITEQADSIIKYSDIIHDFVNEQSSLKKNVMKLNQALDVILEMLADYVESRNVKLFKRFNADVSVNIDSIAFFHVFFQLAKNACGAMPEGGNIYITTEAQTNSVIIEFKDTGKGIDENIMGKIFEPFVSFEKEEKAGLGLAIVYKIIKDHGGEIKVGAPLTEGAAFIISLPILADNLHLVELDK